MFIPYNWQLHTCLPPIYVHMCSTMPDKSNLFIFVLLSFVFLLLTETPIPSQNCPRKNGYFGHKNQNICDTFYYCVDGQFNMITCPSGLVFNPKTGICTWADEAGRQGCSSEDVFEFTCPKVNETEAVTHPRYADPDDCQYFYVCINGETPRRNGCKLGQVFDESNKLCDWARKVPDW